MAIHQNALALLAGPVHRNCSQVMSTVLVKPAITDFVAAETSCEHYADISSPLKLTWQPC